MALGQLIQFPESGWHAGTVVSGNQSGQYGAKDSCPIAASGVIRRLKGSSQPVLIHANDGAFYVIKFFDNLQGPNIAFNEAIGTEVFRACGLPVPAWSPVWISDEFINKNPLCWMSAPDGYRKPKAGWCFGSRFLGLQEAPLREILSSEHFGRIRNRMDFWKVRVLDILCQHADNRQALFIEDEDRSLDAYFIDHGHLFGGPLGAVDPLAAASRYLDKRIYPLLTSAHWDEIAGSLAEVKAGELMRVVSTLPAEWVTSSAMMGLQRFLDRVTDQSLLRRLRDTFLGCTASATMSPRRKQPQRVGRATLRPQIPASAFAALGSGRPRLVVGQQK